MYPGLSHWNLCWAEIFFFMSKKGMALSVYPAPNIMKELESRKMIWVVHVAHVGEMQNTYKIMVRKSKEETIWYI